LGQDYTFPALDVDIEEVKLTFATNLFSVIHINATFAPLVLRAKGTYVSIGSGASLLSPPTPVSAEPPPVAGEHPYVYSSVYNASKAALHAYANTLRIEVAPLGISVITVVTGGVRSNIARTERSLPPGSLYAPINTSFQRRVQQSQELGIATNIYTEQVVSRILGAKGWLWDTQEVWAGTAAHLFWWARWVDRVLPMGIWAPIYEWVFELGKLRGKAGLQKKAD
jgi:1-acylglycerone phosphate reductase